MLVVFSDVEAKTFKEYRTSVTGLTVEGVQRILAQHINSIPTALVAIIEKGIWKGDKSWTSASGRYSVEMYIPED